MDHTFQVDVQWNGGRRGTLSAPDLPTTIVCATPPVFPGGEPGFWSPEHLFAASVNSCFMATFLAVAESFKLMFSDFSCKAVATVDRPEGFFCITSVQLFPELVLTNPSDTEKALRVLEKSKAACLVSRSLTASVTMDPLIR